MPGPSHPHAATLAGAYYEPLFADPELQKFLDPDAALGFDPEIHFRDQFAVCQMEATPEDEDAVLGSVSQRLFDITMSDAEARAAMAERLEKGYGRAMFCQWEGRDPECPTRPIEGMSHSDAHVVWEVMKVLWMSQNIQDFISRPGSYRNHIVRRTSHSGDHDPSRTALAVFFGGFRAEEVDLPEQISVKKDPHLVADLALFKPTERTEKSSRGHFHMGTGVVDFLDVMRLHSGHPNTFEETGDPVAPLILKFFEHFLRRHLRLQFASAAFHDHG